MAGKSAPPLFVSSRQQSILKKLSRRSKLDYQYVIRAQMILLASQGLSNNHITKKLAAHRQTIRTWRKRWSVATDKLSLIEAKTDTDDNELTQAILTTLSDASRRGTPSTFSSEQVCKIIAVSCEDPQSYGHPLSHWTPTALQKEVISRKIVNTISARQIGRFLKGR